MKRGLLPNEKRIFALRSDFVLATGVKNAEQHLGYQGLQETFEEEQYTYLNWQDRYGHPSLTIADNLYNGTVFYAGFVCQRSGYLEVFLSSGRFNRFARGTEGILPLTETQIDVIEAYLSLKFCSAYGNQKIVYYDTEPGNQDDIDSGFFFTNKPFPKDKPYRIHDESSISVTTEIAYADSGFTEARRYIKKFIPPVVAKYSYPGEGSINPGYEDIATVRYSLAFQEKRIWALRSDLILATGVKNAYEKEYGYTGLKDCFSESVHSYLNWNDRYGHPSLTLAEGDYDGSAFYAGYICQRDGYLQVYLVSGRFERTDLSLEQTQILEAYIASQFQAAYGIQDIVFDFGDSNNPQYHATFFADRLFDSSNPQRRYNQATIRGILNTCLPTPKEVVHNEVNNDCNLALRV